jgi:FHS family Na+ dependent glucose MFS transporter 1
MINEDKDKILSTDTNQLYLAVPGTLDSSCTNSATSRRHRAASVTKRNPSVSKPSIIHFLSLVYAFLCMGLGTGITGSTLLKLGEQTNSTMGQLTGIFFTRSCGYFGGTIFAGLLIDRFHDFGNTFLATAALVMSATTLLIPFIYRLIILLPVQLAWGFGAGMVENLTQVLTIRYYSHYNVGPYLQAVHTAFGIGAFVSPLIVAQFISQQQDIPSTVGRVI